MTHPCHKCGRNIEDGKPFCPECGAPQIRVVLPEVSPQPALAGTGSLLNEPAHVFHGDSASPVPRAWSLEVKSCALAAGLAVVLTFVGLNPFVGALAAGWLAVVFSRRSLGSAGSALRPKTGARLGATTGLLLFALSTIFETLAVVLGHKGAELRSAMLEKVQELSQRYPGPEVQPFLDFVKTPEGFALMMAGSVIFALVAFLILGAVGGAISSAVMGRRRP